MLTSIVEHPSVTGYPPAKLRGLPRLVHERRRARLRELVAGIEVSCCSSNFEEDSERSNGDILTNRSDVGQVPVSGKSSVSVSSIPSHPRLRFVSTKLHQKFVLFIPEKIEARSVLLLVACITLVSRNMSKGRHV